jgi:hypothetical protein
LEEIDMTPKLTKEETKLLDLRTRAEATSASREPKPSEDARPSTQYVVEHRDNAGNVQCTSTYEDRALYDHMKETPNRLIAHWQRYHAIHHLHWLPTTGEFVYMTEADGSGDCWFERADAGDVIYFFLFKSMLDTSDDAECQAFFDDLQRHKNKLVRHTTHTGGEAAQ